MPHGHREAVATALRRRAADKTLFYILQLQIEAKQ
jgi:hypothetical protein